MNESLMYVNMVLAMANSSSFLYRIYNSEKYETVVLDYNDPLLHEYSSRLIVEDIVVVNNVPVIKIAFDNEFWTALERRD